MNDLSPADEPISDEIAAQAAAWIALRYGDQRMPANQRDFQRWLNESPTHRLAFDLATEAIMEIRDSNLRDAESDLAELAGRRARIQRAIKRVTSGFGAVLAVTLLFGALYKSQAPQADRYITGVGEQGHVALRDGTRMVLNSGTEVSVTYGEHERRASLGAGEARFSVVKDASRPFIVTARGHEVTAVGTQFLVQEIGSDQVAVTLMEGSIKVGKEPTGLQWVSNKLSRTKVQTVDRPGQRYTFSENDDAAPQADKPNLERLLVWRTANVHFNGLKLVDAAAEMCRDSKTKIRIVETDAANVPVSGSYKAGDLETFAKTIAMQFSLRVDRTASEIVLYGHPKLPHRGAPTAK